MRKLGVWSIMIYRLFEVFPLIYAQPPAATRQIRKTTETHNCMVVPLKAFSSIKKSYFRVPKRLQNREFIPISLL